MSKGQVEKPQLPGLLIQIFSYIAAGKLYIQLMNQADIEDILLFSYETYFKSKDKTYMILIRRIEAVVEAGAGVLVLRQPPTPSVFPTWRILFFRSNGCPIGFDSFLKAL